MKRFGLILILLIALTGLAACGGKETAAPETTKANVAAKPAEAVTETPSQAAKNFFEAVRNRQYSEVREMLSQRSLSNLNDAAKQNNINVDQALKRVIDEDAQEMARNNQTGFETRNEDVRGERAYVEVKANNALEYARLSFVKEENRWKINIDETSPVNR